MSQLRGLNRPLSGENDGALVESVDLAHWDGVKRHIGRVRVYWPFVVFAQDGRAGYNVTHALTGCFVHQQPTIQKAKRYVRALRRVADWEFSSDKGHKAARARRAADRAKLIPRLQRIG